MPYTEKEMMNRLAETQKFLDPYIKQPISIAIVAGSGLGKFADLVEDKIEIAYKDIPHFPVSAVSGHAGKLIFGTVSGKHVVLMAGRVHYYEGSSMQDITYPIRVFQTLNITKLLLTNAAGGMHTAYREGAIMLIRDHINLMGDSPLIGENLNNFGVRFPAMNDAYPESERAMMKTIAQKHNISLSEGVYAGWMGPAYETPAEINYIKTIGADAVGMSTVPEVLVAVHGGMTIVAMSCITNLAAGISESRPQHDEVMEMADKLSDSMSLLVKEYIRKSK